jgi:hypothetical protein
MGTNYYFMTRNKKLAHKYFAVETDWGVTDTEYEIVDSPFLGYEIHLNKLSWGWRPLFQRHKAFKTWNELEKFCHDYKDEIEIFDEYGHSYSFDDYKKIIFDHAAREPEPVRWVYDYDPLYTKFFPEDLARKRLFTERCEPEEAELWIPFDHVKYFETEKTAKKKFNVYDYYIFEGIKYWNDPDYPVDWTEGDFS